MNFIFKIIFFSLVITTPLFGTPHLILHFDINKTLIASDRAGNKSIEQVINELLACEYKFKWDESVKEAISYDEYVHSKDDLWDKRKEQIHHVAIRDDWSYWSQEGCMKSQFGKPFIIDRNDKEVLAIFFDDNIRLDDENENIIAAIDATTGQSLSIKELAKTKQVVRVDTLSAILNDHYFLENVHATLSHLSEGKK